MEDVATQFANRVPQTGGSSSVASFLTVETYPNAYLFSSDAVDDGKSVSFPGPIFKGKENSFCPPAVS